MIAERKAAGKTGNRVISQQSRIFDEIVNVNFFGIGADFIESGNQLVIRINAVSGENAYFDCHEELLFSIISDSGKKSKFSGLRAEEEMAFRFSKLTNGNSCFNIKLCRV